MDKVCNNIITESKTNLLKNGKNYERYDCAVLINPLATAWSFFVKF